MPLDSLTGLPGFVEVQDQHWVHPDEIIRIEPIERVDSDPLDAATRVWLRTGGSLVTGDAPETVSNQVMQALMQRMMPGSYVVPV
jgi:hypothetical protein